MYFPSYPGRHSQDGATASRMENVEVIQVVGLRSITLQDPIPPGTDLVSDPASHVFGGHEWYVADCPVVCRKVISLFV